MNEQTFTENEVIDAIRRAVLAERERCAKLVEMLPASRGDSTLGDFREDVAAAIRSPSKEG